MLVYEKSPPPSSFPSLWKKVCSDGPAGSLVVKTPGYYMHGLGWIENYKNPKKCSYYYDLLIAIVRQDGWVLSNVKLGAEKIKHDPHKMSHNGELLSDLLLRNNLLVCNSSELCDGVNTREKVTLFGTERSVIDFVIVCEDLYSPFFKWK